MSNGLLVINAGSSSLKFSVFAANGGEPALVARGLFEELGGASPAFRASDGSGAALPVRAPQRGADGYGHREALADLLAWIDAQPGLPAIGAVGHRVVHGGPDHARPERITSALLAELERFVPLAPLHQPHNLNPIRILAELHPALPQVACFDTAFHQSQPEVARKFGLPRSYWDEGVRRYGFHGLSYEYVAGVLPEVAGAAVATGRVVVAHLGNGASMCAMHDGRSVASTMGFTALEGLPMGTRCGAIDPGVLLYLMEQKGMGAREITDLLYKRSGLLGLSGVSSDMRALLGSDAPAAAEAVEYFVYRIARELGSLAAALGGLDAVVFTGGIGEHAAAVRAGVCTQARWLGIQLDAAANAAHAARISSDGARTSAWVVPTNEELVIARHAQRLVGGGAGG